MVLNVSPHYPWPLSGVLDNPSSPETISAVQYQLHIGLYVEDFVFIPQIQPRSPYSKYYSKNTSKSISWDMMTIS